MCAGLVATLLSACGSNSVADEERVDGMEPTRVQIHTFAFEPPTVTVPAGTVVSWTNQDEITHTVTSGVARRQGVPGVSEDVPAEPDGTFDGALEGAGSTFDVAFEERGRFTYYCDIHAGMAGTVVVR